MHLSGQKKPSTATANCPIDETYILTVKYNLYIYPNKLKIIKSYFLNKKRTKHSGCLVEIIFEKFRKILKFQSARHIQTSKLFFNKKFKFYGENSS